MEKWATFPGKTASGIYCQTLFGSTGAFEKVAGAPAFSDWETGKDLKKFISTITKRDRERNAYVLVNALGAGEYFGSNINADYFPWNALSHEGDDYGYLTFLNAHAFQHHVNKDPTRAFGKPVLSILNHPMKRVELIIQLDREKAKLEGADGIITRIDAGEFPDVSMGCKVPFDICSICANKSKTRNDYCQHMLPPQELRDVYGPNKVLPDGRKICVYNTLPRFFDISFVFIGADKCAKVMAKLASKGRTLWLGEVFTASKDTPSLVDASGVPFTKDHWMVQELHSALQKEASAPQEKTAKRKLGEIIKNVPTGVFASQRLPELERQESEIPSTLLDSMAEGHGLSTCCSSSGMLGIILQPREFQRVVLIRMGEGGLAEDLDSQREVFRQVPELDDSVQVDKGLADRKLLDILQNLVQDRSAFGEPFRVRVLRVSTKKPLPTETRIAHPLLDKISAAYNGYRQNLMLKLSQAVEVVQSDPRLREVVGDSLVNMFMKTSSNAPILSLDSVAYLMGAHLQDRSLLSNTAVAEAIAAINPCLLTEGHDLA